MRASLLRIVTGAAVLGLVFTAGLGTSSPARGQTSGGYTPQGTQMVSDLQTLTDANWARIAGTDKNLAPHVNGHDEFLDGWTKLIVDALHGLPTTVVQQHFTPPGFTDVPLTVPATNVIVAVPGSQHPNQTVVIGCHPDGVPLSHGSAYDDASGCIIALGLARSLGDQWRQQGLPSLTVQFDLFDAEEQGLGGSIYYLASRRRGALMPAPVFMINEEQSGINYPVRPFGLVANDTLVTNADLTPDNPAATMTNYQLQVIGTGMGPFRTPKKADLALARTRVTAARDAAFKALQPSYASIPYRDGTRDAFTAGDTGKVEIGPDVLGGSDNQPFEADGLPTVTFGGDASFYDKTRPDWAYPFDQPTDTFTNLACDSGGSPTPSTALGAALDLEAAMSLSLVDAYAPPAAGDAGVTAFSTPPGKRQKTSFMALGAGPFSWRFGDGTRASGQTVTHVYKKAGKYTVKLTAGSKQVIWKVKVPDLPPDISLSGPSGSPPDLHWAPPELQSIDGCH